MSLICGIDPGKNGGIAFYDTDSKEISLYEIPKVGNQVNMRQLTEIFDTAWDYEHSHFIMEEVHAIFGSSAKSTFNFGWIFGLLEGIIVGNEHAYSMVKPKDWQKVIFEGIPIIRKPSKKMRGKDKKTGKMKTKTVQGSPDTKKMAILAVQRLFPHLDIAKKKKPHDGLVDALLLAEYGRRTVKSP